LRKWLREYRTEVDLRCGCARNPSVRTATVPNPDGQQRRINWLAGSVRRLFQASRARRGSERAWKSTWERAVRNGGASFEFRPLYQGRAADNVLVLKVAYWFG